ncbi:Cupredoxin [Aspergillus sergii]|uniref:Cupredoxin n=1 Tax=Aspergillus sergii TaxID=1034303 RepID=A0A5N6WNG5_9EURO|nr:Cupredoxin [Aspergillus sergii]
MLIIPLLLIYALCGTAIFLQPTSHHRKPKPKRANSSPGNSTSSAALPTGTPCAGNSPENRSQWCEYDIDTDWSEVVPDTGVTREYWLDIDEIAAAPDGYLRTVMAINGSIPGPTIYADWGDHVVVHVTNHLHEAKNGTSIHWHGIWQRGTNEHDGVVSITQCPIAPGSSMTYRWRAMQYGSSWYHSHIGLQAWNGVFGGIIINGPATANYDEDAGVMILSDWTHETADEMYQFAQLCGPPELPSGLINGTNVFGTGNHTRGSRLNLQVTKGKSYRLRLVNAALDTNFIFMIDNHKLTTIAMDLVPIEPFSTYSVTIGMGQRYDIIITADQASLADSFWIRAIPLEACSENADPSNIRGILHYEDTPSVPKTLGFIYSDETCDDMQAPSLVPHVRKSVPSPDLQEMVDADSHKNAKGLFRWYLNSTTMEILWEDPTLMQIYDGESAFPNSSAVISLPKADQWFYLDIETRQPIGHPIHLHGHDFFILSQGQGAWNGSSRTENPPRRDTAMLPSNGHLVIAFQADNPGAWLMHCHIGWHTTEGFALQFLERTDEVVGTIDYDLLQDTCESWITYDELHNIVQEDSGV